ncbi:MAG: methyltransferase domain-containing protein [Candidatus Binataceae bacterium]|nr:methyltransferase domain-containing protein [Candidatus Binataceae bacterium]
MAGSGASLDMEKAKNVAQTVIGDVASVLHGALCFIGDRLGLFKAMAGAGPITIDQLAAKTGLSARYLREWLAAMAAARYVEYDAAGDSYLLTPEYAAALADEDSPFFIGSYFQMAQAAVSVAPQVAEAFKSGKGVTQAEYPPWFFEATERNSRTRYQHKLLRKWIPAMPQVAAALNAGGSAADVGCGGGRAAIMIAQAFGKARVTGFDIHAESIERARRNAVTAGVADRVSFEAANGSALPAGRFDFVTTFDVVHDSVDPVSLMSAIRRALKPDGTYLVQEINISDAVQDNIRPMGKMVYSVSTLYCMTTSLAHGGAGIGAAMGEPKARELAAAAGFSRFTRLPVKDDFAVLYELRP